MIVDFSVTNFRSFQDEQLFSMNVETNKKSLQGNFTEIEDGNYSILKSAAIFGPNASGKSNLLTAFQALQWLITTSHRSDEGSDIPPYKPFKLSPVNRANPVKFNIEFVVPSGIRYEYSILYSKSEVISESLFSFPKRKKSLVFSKGKTDTWETVKFGASYKGGGRRFSFFPNSTYISRAGNDASAPENIREVVRYFRSIQVLGAEENMLMALNFVKEGHLETVSNLICLADTGIQSITVEKSTGPEIKLPDDMSEKLAKFIQNLNRKSYKFLHKDQTGQEVEFEQDEISDGTEKLFKIIPILLMAIANGVPIFIDELDGRLHTNLVALVFELFNDGLANPDNAQLIVTTHDTNMMDPNVLRRDQIWLVTKVNGASQLTCLDEFDKNLVRPTSPFEDFYKDGRLGGLPSLSYAKIRDVVRHMPKRKGYNTNGDYDA